MQLVPETTGASHRRDVLADAGQVERPVARVVERRGEPLASAAEPARPSTGTTRPASSAFTISSSTSARPVVAIRRSRADRRVLAQDPRLQLLQAPAGLHAELADERATRILVGLERLCLASGAVVGLHQQLAWPLAQRLLGDERLELGHDVGVASELGVGADPLLVRDEAQLLEPADLGLGEIVVGQVGECRAPPERECLTQRRGALVRLCRARVGEQLLEPR